MIWIANAAFWILLGWWIQTSNQPDDFAFLLCAALISAICFFLIVNPWSEDPLEPIKLVAFFYGMSFGLGPLLLVGDGNYAIPYFGGAWVRLLSEGSVFAFYGLGCLLLGYYVYPILVRRDSSETGSVELSATVRKVVTGIGICVSCIGAISYIILVQEAGGLGHFLSYSAGRADIFGGVFGGFYFGTFLLISGINAIGCVHAQKHPLLIMIGALGIGIAYAPFQGREEAIAPIICGLILVHYKHKRLKTKWVMVAAAILLVLASFIGYFRSVDKSDARKMGDMMGQYKEQVQQHMSHTVTHNLEQMDAFLIALRYVETTHNTFNGRTLLGWLEPIDKHVLGNIIDSQHAGRLMDILVMPEHRWSHTALSPSILGELYINFEMPGIIIGLCLYGLVLRSLYEKALRISQKSIIMMVYPYMIWILSKAVIDGSALLFRPFIVAAPAVLAYVIVLLATVGQSPTIDSTVKRYQ